MSKFKVGDKVRVTKTPWSASEMQDKIGFITEVDNDPESEMTYQVDEFWVLEVESYQEPKTSPCAAHDKESEEGEYYEKTETNLEKAHRLYPKGTKFKSPSKECFGLDMVKQILFSCGEFVKGDGGIYDKESGWAVYMESNGWGEILETMPKVEEKESFGEVEEEDIYDAVRRMRELDENPIKPLGATKHDQGKVSFSCVPQLALYQVAEVFTKGAIKYNRFNYSGEMNLSRYTDALERHLHAYKTYKDVNDLDETNVHHLACVAANALMALDAILTGKGIDDRNQVYKK
jgi:hypothetical protein